MIIAKFEKNSEKIVSVDLKGHADSADEGYDMVCSAVSAISLTIANGITEVLKINPSISLEDGFLSVNLKMLSLEEIDKCQILLETMLVGLQGVEISYGEYIEVEVEEV
ncbi:ribosomal-processing cysteine protease Prp [Clostridium sp. YIM B02515]|uniref:Ribosomal processing cysteine protease Prp n=1 Tax=Clostridium rhizosphaerae TaxID=2803861 RepID=A0ABS1T787_9CLOT|nr:ribosomal-processing cysteine protease Prp [Clostridium rhizosphaerae]MBL4935206.1 ribosomal-processing cysteine protease Prp [Clostridium rhizosphaerae]